MNFLAHLYFAENSQHSLYGNLLGDFVKGSPDQFIDPVILNGIAQHRAIDKYTDAHPVVKRSKSRISAERRRFSGIMIDVFYDHYLAINWEQYSPENFSIQTSDWYNKLKKETYLVLPARFSRTIEMMTKNDWFSMYKEPAGINKAIDGISKRIRFENNMHGGGVELTNNYDALEDDFHAFFPDLVTFVRSYQKKLDSVC